MVRSKLVIRDQRSSAAPSGTLTARRTRTSTSISRSLATAPRRATIDAATLLTKRALDAKAHRRTDHNVTVSTCRSTANPRQMLRMLAILRTAETEQQPASSASRLEVETYADRHPTYLERAEKTCPRDNDPTWNQKQGPRRRLRPPPGRTLNASLGSRLVAAWAQRARGGQLVPPPGAGRGPTRPARAQH